MLWAAETFIGEAYKALQIDQVLGKTDNNQRENLEDEITDWLELLTGSRIFETWKFDKWSNFTNSAVIKFSFNDKWLQVNSTEKSAQVEKQ